MHKSASNCPQQWSNRNDPLPQTHLSCHGDDTDLHGLRRGQATLPQSQICMVFCVHLQCDALGGNVAAQNWTTRCSFPIYIIALAAVAGKHHHGSTHKTHSPPGRGSRLFSPEAVARLIASLAPFCRSADSPYPLSASSYGPTAMDFKPTPL